MDAAARQSGQVIGGKYQLERVLGAGGMGEVWSARHTSLKTSVALKFLKGSSASEPETRSRFELEARVTAQLKTRLAVQVFDYGVADQGEPFLVMELLEGESLAARLHRFGRFAPATAMQLLGQAARALDKAHALGIVHRDFKPGNIFIVVDEDYREQVKVMDFGLAKIMGELDAPVSATEALEDASPSSFTRTGALLGTPSYMAPEQISGKAEIGPATDVWAFGVVAFECLTGQVPFVGRRLSDLFEAIRARQYLKGSALVPELGAAFDAWFELVCAPEPAQRFSTPVIAFNELATAINLPTLSAREVPLLSDHGSGPHPDPSLPRVTPMPGRPPSGSGPFSSAEVGFEPTLKRGATPSPSGDGSAATLKSSQPGGPIPRSRWNWVVALGVASGLGGLAIGLRGMFSGAEVEVAHAAPAPAPVEKSSAVPPAAVARPGMPPPGFPPPLPPPGLTPPQFLPPGLPPPALLPPAPSTAPPVAAVAPPASAIAPPAAAPATHAKPHRTAKGPLPPPPKAEAHEAAAVEPAAPAPAPAPKKKADGLNNEQLMDLGIPTK